MRLSDLFRALVPRLGHSSSEVTSAVGTKKFCFCRLRAFLAGVGVCGVTGIVGTFPGIFVPVPRQVMILFFMGCTGVTDDAICCGVVTFTGVTVLNGCAAISGSGSP